MIEGLVFPDVRAAISDLIDGHEHLDATVDAVQRIPADEKGTILAPNPVCLVYVSNGPEGFVDRVSRVVLELYSNMLGPQAVDYLESVRASIVGWDIETDHGYLDKVRCVEIPTDVPYQSDTIEKATALLDVTTRPLN